MKKFSCVLVFICILSLITFSYAQEEFSLGDSGNQIATAKKKLAELGYCPKIDVTDERFTRELMDAVKEFQRQNDIYPDGKLNTKTQEILYENPQPYQSKEPQPTSLPKSTKIPSSAPVPTPTQELASIVRNGYEVFECIAPVSVRLLTKRCNLETFSGADALKYQYDSKKETFFIDVYMKQSWYQYSVLDPTCIFSYEAMKKLLIDEFISFANDCGNKIDIVVNIISRDDYLLETYTSNNHVSYFQSPKTYEGEMIVAHMCDVSQNHCQKEIDNIIEFASYWYAKYDQSWNYELFPTIEYDELHNSIVHSICLDMNDTVYEKAHSSANYGHISTFLKETFDQIGCDVDVCHLVKNSDDLLITYFMRNGEVSIPEDCFFGHYVCYGEKYTGRCFSCDLIDSNSPEGRDLEFEKLYKAIECLQDCIFSPRSMHVVRIVTNDKYNERQGEGHTYEMLVGYYSKNYYGVEYYDQKYVRIFGNGYDIQGEVQDDSDYKERLNNWGYSFIISSIKLYGYRDIWRDIDDEMIERLNKKLQTCFPDISDMYEIADEY